MSIFSTYKTGENRVTASILAVLHSLSFTRCQRILAALMEQSEFELIRFENQVAKGGKGVPDAEIISSCRLLIETKIKHNAVRTTQLQRHLERLSVGSERTQALLVLTPDSTQPAQIDEVNDKRVVWASFASLDQAINELLEDNKDVISEREAFLLRELQIMLDDEGLIRSEKDVVVIPAKHAWPEYLEFSAYACQPNRPFRCVQYLAFYHKNQIYDKVPKILESLESVVMEKGLPGKLGKLVDRMLESLPGIPQREEGKAYKILLLSRPDAPETISLPNPVVNDLKSESGVPTAFTQNQRYVELTALKKARHTSELIGGTA